MKETYVVPKLIGDLGNKLFILAAENYLRFLNLSILD